MSWVAVARKDFRDAIRSRMFLALAVVFGLFAVAIGGAYGYFDVFRDAGATNQGLILVSFVATPVSLFVTLTAVIIAHKAVVGERANGSLKILLSLPHTRLDVIVGKIVGRSLVLAVPALLSLVVGVGVGAALIGDLAPLPLLALLGAMVVLIVTYVSLMVGLSSMTSSTSLATAGAVGYFVVFELLWGTIGQVVLLVRDYNPLDPPNWYFFYQNVPPGSAFNMVLGEVLSSLAEAEQTVTEVAAIGQGYDAAYASPWVAAVILLLWLVVPAAIGYWRFSNADL
ncbi:ABC transporter permease subunit [Halapricum desulfuricans]|uniref:ABC-type transport system involved in multi-copper enzyme maturation, permease component n=1 Tax=Halapricum desulfuricans TaxID=2841257 RepID=A0A897N0G9_9EURY|nr:ABC transporter permease subunit [Halapricum desulfuricans]QSG06184.1 ABC-type transport system involved in multi-copper enzyme maturation, permease component [Halapricum desulfuricans]